MKKYLVLGLAALLLTTVLSPETALAGGRGNGNWKPSDSGASLTVTPATVAAWGGTYVVTGSGFNAGQTVHFSVSEPGCCIAFNVAADATGNVSFSRTAGFPGTYKVDAYQWNGRKSVLMATVSFSVVEP